VTTMRRCAWCRCQFRSSGEAFCGSICAQSSAWADVITGLQNFARADAEKRVNQQVNGTIGVE
jgi:hypothetical protein